MPHATAPRLTRRALVRLGGGLTGLAGLGFLAACGTTPTPQSVGVAPAATPLPPTATTAIQATAPPSPTIVMVPTAQTASAVPGATTMAAPPSPTLPTAPTIASPSVTATMTPPPFNGIPQGRTADGFPFLGNPDAAVTLIDYSDFL
ncbi:MAG TPA: hypothetical protein VIL85_22885 [Thermomicrobiales bacterium]